jgi:hypothetical protein
VDPTRFELDRTPRDYNALAAEAFWRALVQTDRVFKTFRGRFLMVAAAGHISGGLYNPSVTIALMTVRRIPLARGIYYIVA